MGRLRGYGAEALRVLVLLAGFAFTGYVAVRLSARQPAGVAYWFVGSAVAHDLVLFPLYAVADAALVRTLRRRPVLAAVRGVPWLNHLRFPVVISDLLLLVWSPLVFRVPRGYHGITGLTPDPYLGRWAAVTGTLFALSAVAYAARVCLLRRGGEDA